MTVFHSSGGATYVRSKDVDIKCINFSGVNFNIINSMDILILDFKNIHAIEIKNTRRPSNRDVRNLYEFSKSMKKKVRMYLFYPGDEYFSINDVKIVPIAHLFRGK